MPYNEDNSYHSNYLLIKKNFDGNHGLNELCVRDQFYNFKAKIMMF